MPRLKRRPALAHLKPGHSLVTPADREALIPRKAPYLLKIGFGRSLGLYRGRKGATWVVRLTGKEGGVAFRVEATLGVPPEERGRSDLKSMDFEEAIAAAKAWSPAPHRGTDGADSLEVLRSERTVGDALEQHLAVKHMRLASAQERESFKATISRIRKIQREIGSLKLSELVEKDLTDWLTVLVATPPQLRAKKDGKPNIKDDYDPDDETHVLARQSTANRALSDVKAALNLAWRNKWVDGDAAWRFVKKFQNCTGKREQVLSIPEQSQFLNNCSPEFRPLAYAALLTGARLGAMRSWRVKDFRPLEMAVRVAYDKGRGHERLAPLTDEGLTAFHHICLGRDPEEPMFLRANGKPWGRSHQFREMQEATKGIETKVCFYSLRHTCITTWLISGVEESHIGRAVGTSEKMIKEHYNNARVSEIAKVINSKAVRLSSDDETVRDVVAFYNQKRIQRITIKKELEFTWESLNPKSYLGKGLGGRTFVERGTRRPSRAELAALVASMPLSKVARQVGTSDVTIGKWCRDYGIAVPGRSHWAAQARAERQEKGEMLGPESSPACPSRPTREELAKAIWEMPAGQLGERYGVAGQTVLGWARKWGIDRPDRSYWIRRQAEDHHELKSQAVADFQDGQREELARQKARRQIGKKRIS